MSANAGWSMLAGGVALGVIAGFMVALRWQDTGPLGARPSSSGVRQAGAEPNTAVVQALEAQAARVTRLESDVEKLSATVADLTRALRAATDGQADAAGPASSALPWLPFGALDVAKAWYAERIHASIQSLATQAENAEAATTATTDATDAADATATTDAQKRAWAEQANAEAAHLRSLRQVVTESQFARWLQSTGHGERVPSRAELTATAAALQQRPK